jgi:alginate O-acetyltransferase complex protein AlgI
LLDFSLYVTFFPQLVAGPIVRAGYFLPQCKQPPKVQAHEIAWGINLLLFGLFAKVVLADYVMAPIADQVFNAPSVSSTLDAWIGMFAFSGQIFFDFSGYTLCALGAAMILGFTLPDNFRSPYAAIGFSDFWQRWHISLSSWMRDYLYISMGGNRKGGARTFRNLIFTMLLGGLWHGASWNFAIWGGLHGLYLIAEHGLLKIFGGRRLTGAVEQTGIMLLTFMLVTLAWVPFRATNLEDSLTFFGRLFTLLPGSDVEFSSKLLVGVVISATIAWHAFTRSKTLEERWVALPVMVRVLFLMIAILLIGLCSTGDSRAFIYFQF